MSDIVALMRKIGAQAKAAAEILAQVPAETKTRALLAMAAAVREHRQEILTANARDVAAAKEKGISAALIDRLSLDDARIEGIASAVDDIAALPDPVGEVIGHWVRPNGLDISRVRTPLGVIGIIYESRPNVTMDAGALCLRTGNAAILRGGSESHGTSQALYSCLRAGLQAANLPETAIQLVPTTDRACVGEMLKGLDGAIEVIVPRGGKSLIARVREDARVPVFSHLEGICHTYVRGPVDIGMAKEIVLNAKLRRPGICGAMETLLVDENVADSHLQPVVQALLDAGCEVRGDKAVCAVDSRVKPASDDDWDTEYLEEIVSVRVVKNTDQALDHIRVHGSGHTEAIVSDDLEAVSAFLERVDSAIVMHNTSSQFADGGEFGMGAEIGIATGKMHARGPVGAEQLTSFKYVVRGSGQVRPG